MFLLGLLILVAGVGAFCAAMYCFGEAGLEKDKEERRVKEDAERAIKEREEDYEDYIQYINDSSEWIINKAKDIKDSSLKSSLKTISEILDSIAINVSKDEYTVGNLPKIRSQILPQFKSIIEKYLRLQSTKTNKGLEKTMEKLRDTVDKSVEVFNSLLNEAMTDDIIGAETDAAVFTQYTKMNGLGQTQEETLSFK